MIARTGIVKIIDMDCVHSGDIRQVIVDTRPPLECRDCPRRSAVEDGHCQMLSRSCRKGLQYHPLSENDSLVERLLSGCAAEIP